MHLLYPLDEVVSTWELAQSLEHCLASGGLELKAGVLELRPNVKSYGANYLAIRAPLSGEGNAYWAPQFSDFGLLDDLVLFQQLFCSLRQFNRFIPFKGSLASLEDCSSNRRGPVQDQGVIAAGQRRLAEGFTGSGQVNFNPVISPECL